MDNLVKLRSDDIEPMKINNLIDIIKETKKYSESRKRPRNERCSLNMDLECLISCIKPLEKLNDLIGMEDIKQNIVDQVLFFAQNLNKNEMMHTCLSGPPGVGKTTVGKILAELYCTMGLLETDNFSVVSRPELIGGYLGQTALKTQKVLKSSLGGVLFIDEAYSIGAGSRDDDMYAKECIDTINKFLSENTSNFIMIIAGYREELDQSFFSMNKGLRRRFPWTFDIKDYTVANLKNIFVYQVFENNWKFEENVYNDKFKVIETLFQEYRNSDPKFFENNGGDTLTIFDKAKICHSRRVFGLKRRFKGNLSEEDIRASLELIKKQRKNKIDRTPPYGMYL